MKLGRRDRLLLLMPLAALLTFWLVAPAALGFIETFTTYTPLSRGFHVSGFDNYLTVVRNSGFLAGIRNVTVLTVIAVPLELAIGLGLAYALRGSFRGRWLVRILLLVPWLVSPIANGVMWHFLLDPRTGFLGYGLAWLGQASEVSPLGQKGLALPTTILVEVWRMAPLVTFLLVPGLSGVSTERWEQATIDGLPWHGRIRHVALPAVRPLVLAISLLLVGAALGTFDSLVVMTGGGPGSETIMPALYSYAQAFEISNYPIGATAGWLIAGAMLVIGLIYVRFAKSDAT